MKKQMRILSNILVVAMILAIMVPAIAAGPGDCDCGEDPCICVCPDCDSNPCGCCPDCGEYPCECVCPDCGEVDCEGDCIAPAPTPIITNVSLANDNEGNRRIYVTVTDGEDVTTKNALFPSSVKSPFEFTADKYSFKMVFTGNGNNNSSYVFNLGENGSTVTINTGGSGGNDQPGGPIREVGFNHGFATTPGGGERVWPLDAPNGKVIFDNMSNPPHELLIALGNNTFKLVSEKYYCPICGSNQWVSYSNMTEDPDGGTVQLIHPGNPELELIVTKYVDGTKATSDMAGLFKFQLNGRPQTGNDNRDPTSVTVAIDENGEARFNLVAGFYYELTEVEVPNGYKDETKIKSFSTQGNVTSPIVYRWDNKTETTEELYKLEVKKVYSGSALPEGFKITLTGPEGFEARTLDLSNFNDDGPGFYVWHFTQISVGTYIATEENYNVTGYTRSGSATTVTETLPGTETGNDDYHIVLTLVNIYSADPPTTGTPPPTTGTPPPTTTTTTTTTPPPVTTPVIVQDDPPEVLLDDPPPPLTYLPPPDDFFDDPPPPLSEMPKTSNSGLSMPEWYYALCMSLLAIGAVIRVMNRTKATDKRRR